METCLLCDSDREDIPRIVLHGFAHEICVKENQALQTRLTALEKEVEAAKKVIASVKILKAVGELGPEYFNLNQALAAYDKAVKEV